MLSPSKRVMSSSISSPYHHTHNHPHSLPHSNAKGVPTKHSSIISSPPIHPSSNSSTTTVSSSAGPTYHYSPASAAVRIPPLGKSLTLDDDNRGTPIKILDGGVGGVGAGGPSTPSSAFKGIGATGPNSPIASAVRRSAKPFSGNRTPTASINAGDEGNNNRVLPRKLLNEFHTEGNNNNNDKMDTVINNNNNMNIDKYESEIVTYPYEGNQKNDAMDVSSPPTTSFSSPSSSSSIYHTPSKQPPPPPPPPSSSSIYPPQPPGSMTPKSTIFSPPFKHAVGVHEEVKHLPSNKYALLRDRLHLRRSQHNQSIASGMPRRLILQQSEIDIEDEEELDPFLFIKNLPPLSPSLQQRLSPIPSKSLSPTPYTHTLALDLDETLVHCSIAPLDKSELTFSVNFNGIDYEVFVKIRPHLKTFLSQVSQWFEIIVFTASQKVYADRLLNFLDPDKKFINYRVFRDHCVCMDGNYLKDLTILNRSLKNIAIIDNSIQAFGLQLDNGIPIESWFDDENDKELLNMLPFLNALRSADDVRPLIRSTFKLQEIVQALS